MLDDLLVKINVDMSPLTSAAPKIDATLNAFADTINHVNATPLNISIANSDALKADIDSIALQMDEMAVTATDLSEHWIYINRGVSRASESMREFSISAQRAATASDAILVKTSATRMAPIKAPTAGGSLIGLAAAALAVKAVGSVSTAMTSAKTAIRSIDTTTKTAVLSLDRFRMGLAAPAVNPALNTLPGLISKIATSVSSAVESFRGFGDATIAGAPAIMTSIAGGMQKILGTGDTLQATVSKITSQFDLHRGALDRVAKIYPTTGTAVGALKNAMDFIAPAAEKVAQGVDAANDKLRDAAISARNLGFVATGTFIKTGTSADIYARGAYHALLPTRLMAFEAKFASGNMALMRRAFATVTHPIHAVGMAVQKSRGEFRELRATLPPLTGGLQLGLRAMRAFAHGTFFASQGLSALKTAVRPVTMVGGALWSLVRPARAASVGVDGVAISARKAGVVIRGITGATTAVSGGFRSMAASSSRAASSLGSGIANGARLGSLAVAGFGVAMAGMAVSTAMATEKNNAVFGTMLHSMEQGKAVVASLQNTQAAGLFDNTALLDASRLLYKAGVPAAELAGKMDQLGNIAAGASVEVGFLADKYMIGVNTGFGLGVINDMAREGIDIYGGLAAATGVSGEALSKMISEGQIGVTEMDAALAHLTEGNGIYAGSMTAMGNTTGGMLSQIKNNFMQALGGVGGAGLEAFKPILAGLVQVSVQSKQWITSIVPIVTQVTMTMSALFTGTLSVIRAVFSAIFGSAQATFSAMLGSAMQWTTKFRWFFENILPLAEFVWVTVALGAVTMFNDIAYWLTDAMPAYLSWFGQNWRDVFTDLGNATVAIFTNLGSNIKNAMIAIWDFIKSGGTADLELAWTPLLTGFESTVAALPDIPERAMTALEQSLQTQTETLGTSIADSYDRLQMEAQAAMNLTPPVMPEIDPTLQGQAGQTGKDDSTETGGTKRTSFAVDSLDRGSEAALKTIFANQREDKTGQQALAEHKKTNKLLGQLASNNSQPKVAVQGAV